VTRVYDLSSDLDTRAASVLAKVRRRQLDAARRGNVSASDRYARRARRVRKFLKHARQAVA
jgi:hypothetical protein